MAKTFNFTFSVNCLIDRNFNNSMGIVKGQMRQVNNQTKLLQEKLKALDSELYKNEIDFGSYADKVKVLNKELSVLNSKKIKLNGLIDARQNLKNTASSFVTTGLSIYAMAQPLIGVIKTSANFEAAMSKVGAITRATDKDMALLTRTARTLGEKTQFSATQAAEAMSYLGMAGWNSQQIMAGMPGLLNLAAAGGTDLARTADIVSDNLTAFGLAADKSAHMADVYATVITRTNTNVEMLGDTMKYAAPVAYAFGASMEETAALAGLMANSGIKASQAGTALRAGFLRLAGPPKMASKAMAQLGMSMQDITAEQKESAMALASLGISMSDTSGPKKMSVILTELRNKTAQLGQEEKLAALKAIFGQEAATGWLAVLNSGDGVFEKLVADLEKSDGAADKMAKRMNANAKGAAIRFQSAMESVAISVGSTLLPAIADITDTLAGYAGTISQIAGEHPALISGILSVGASVAGLVLAVKGLSVLVAGYQAVAKAAAAGQLVWNATLAANPIGMIIIGVGGLIAIGYQLYKNWDAVCAGLVGAWNWLKGAAVGVFDWYVSTLLSLPSKAAYAVGYIIGWFMTIPDNLLSVIQSTDDVGWAFIEKATQWGKDAYNGLIGWFSDLPSKLGGLVDSTWEGIKSKFSFGIQAGSGAQVAQNAAGGIYGRGAFLTTFAENDGESAIPHTPNRRNIGLLAKTNEIMGSPLGGGSISAVFSPQITVQGNADTAAIDTLMTQKMQEFKAMLADLQKQQRRVSYA